MIPSKEVEQTNGQSSTTGNTHHASVNNICRYCNAILESFRDLITHLKTHHREVVGWSTNDGDEDEMWAEDQVLETVRQQDNVFDNSNKEAKGLLVMVSHSYTKDLTRWIVIPNQQQNDPIGLGGISEQKKKTKKDRPKEARDRPAIRAPVSKSATYEDGLGKLSLLTENRHYYANTVRKHKLVGDQRSGFGSKRQCKEIVTGHVNSKKAMGYDTNLKSVPSLKKKSQSGSDLQTSQLLSNVKPAGVIEPLSKMSKESNIQTGVSDSNQCSIFPKSGELLTKVSYFAVPQQAGFYYCHHCGECFKLYDDIVKHGDKVQKEISKSSMMMQDSLQPRQSKLTPVRPTTTTCRTLPQLAPINNATITLSSGDDQVQIISSDGSKFPPQSAGSSQKTRHSKSSSKHKKHKGTTAERASQSGKNADHQHRVKKKKRKHHHRCRCNDPRRICKKHAKVQRNKQQANLFVYGQLGSYVFVPNSNPLGVSKSSISQSQIKFGPANVAVPQTTKLRPTNVAMPQSTQAGCTKSDVAKPTQLGSTKPALTQCTQLGPTDKAMQLATNVAMPQSTQAGCTKSDVAKPTQLGSTKPALTQSTNIAIQRATQPVHTKAAMPNSIQLESPKHNLPQSIEPGSAKPALQIIKSNQLGATEMVMMQSTQVRNTAEKLSKPTQLISMKPASSQSNQYEPIKLAAVQSTQHVNTKANIPKSTKLESTKPGKQMMKPSISQLGTTTQGVTQSPQAGNIKGNSQKPFQFGSMKPAFPQSTKAMMQSIQSGCTIVDGSSKPALEYPRLGATTGALTNSKQFTSAKVAMPQLHHQISSTNVMQQSTHAMPLLYTPPGHTKCETQLGSTKPALSQPTQYGPTNVAMQQPELASSHTTHLAPTSVALSQSKHLGSTNIAMQQSIQLGCATFNIQSPKSSQLGLMKPALLQSTHNVRPTTQSTQPGPTNAALTQSTQLGCSTVHAPMSSQLRTTKPASTHMGTTNVTLPQCTQHGYTKGGIPKSTQLGQLKPVLLQSSQHSQLGSTVVVPKTWSSQLGPTKDGMVQQSSQYGSTRIAATQSCQLESNKTALFPSTQIGRTTVNVPKSTQSEPTKPVLQQSSQLAPTKEVVFTQAGYIKGNISKPTQLGSVKPALSQPTQPGPTNIDMPQSVQHGHTKCDIPNSAQLGMNKPVLLQSTSYGSNAVITSTLSPQLGVTGGARVQQSSQIGSAKSALTLSAHAGHTTGDVAQSIQIGSTKPDLSQSTHRRTINVSMTQPTQLGSTNVAMQQFPQAECAKVNTPKSTQVGSAKPALPQLTQLGSTKVGMLQTLPTHSKSTKLAVPLSNQHTTKSALLQSTQQGSIRLTHTQPTKLGSSTTTLTQPTQCGSSKAAVPQSAKYSRHFEQSVPTPSSQTSQNSSATDVLRSCSTQSKPMRISLESTGPQSTRYMMNVIKSTMPKTAKFMTLKSFVKQTSELVPTKHVSQITKVVSSKFTMPQSNSTLQGTQGVSIRNAQFMPNACNAPMTQSTQLVSTKDTMPQSPQVVYTKDNMVQSTKAVSSKDTMSKPAQSMSIHNTIPQSTQQVSTRYTIPQSTQVLSTKCTLPLSTQVLSTKDTMPQSTRLVSTKPRSTQIVPTKYSMSQSTQAVSTKGCVSQSHKVGSTKHKNLIKVNRAHDTSARKCWHCSSIYADRNGLEVHIIKKHKFGCRYCKSGNLGDRVVRSHEMINHGQLYIPRYQQLKMADTKEKQLLAAYNNRKIKENNEDQGSGTSTSSLERLTVIGEEGTTLAHSESSDKENEEEEVFMISEEEDDDDLNKADSPEPTTSSEMSANMEKMMVQQDKSLAVKAKLANFLLGKNLGGPTVIGDEWTTQVQSESSDKENAEKEVLMIPEEENAGDINKADPPEPTTSSEILAHMEKMMAQQNISLAVKAKVANFLLEKISRIHKEELNMTRSQRHRLFTCQYCFKTFPTFHQVKYHETLHDVMQLLQQLTDEKD